MTTPTDLRQGLENILYFGAEERVDMLLALIDRVAKEKVEEAVDIVDRIHMQPNPQQEWAVDGLKRYVLSQLFP